MRISRFKRRFEGHSMFPKPNNSLFLSYIMLSPNYETDAVTLLDQTEEELIRCYKIINEAEKMASFYVNGKNPTIARDFLKELEK